MGLAVSCYNIVHRYAACERERIILQDNSTPLKVFSPSSSLKDVAIDLLTKLVPMYRGVTNLLVIKDRFTKLVLSIYRAPQLRKSLRCLLSHGSLLIES